MTQLLDDVNLILLDLDGVVYAGDTPIEGAAKAINSLQDKGFRVGYVTNNSSREPQDICRQLNSMGVNAGASDVIGSAYAAARVLAASFPERSPILVVGGTGLRTAVEEAGLTVVDSAEDQPVAVVQGFDRSVGWVNLAEACYAIRAGVRWIATNTDLTLPTSRGLAPGNGSLVATLSAATGQKPESVGKPEAGLFTTAIDSLGGGQALMVGDRLDTDIVGAHRAGIPAVLVLTGASSVTDLLMAQGDARPDAVLLSLGDLFEPYEISKSDSGWVCNGWTCRIDEGQIRVSDADGNIPRADNLSAIRAVCAAVWEHCDAGGDVKISAQAKSLWAGDVDGTVRA